MQFFMFHFFIFLEVIIKEQLKNEEISNIEVRLIGDDGEQLGIVSAEVANEKAKMKGLDLVMISPSAKPAVCKIMDYSKFKFDQAKKLKDQKKQQKAAKLKEMSLSISIETHDLMTKAKHVQKFLAEGNKVKVAIRMKGRQMARPQTGIEVMNKFAEMLVEFGTIDKPPVVQGRNIFMFMAPITKK